jgi:superfamily I DNA and/or RNA helicase
MLVCVRNADAQGASLTQATARTIDTVQGGEADFVFYDFVRMKGTAFNDDPHR